ncbi:MAG: hypothetical protein WAW53_04905, partial [Candidatus Dormiibacterota bacterium]
MRTAPRATTSGHIDVRVAGAPIVGLRFHLDSRAADLDERADELERRLIEVGVQRANLMVRFRAVEEARQQALEVLPGMASPAIVAEIAATFAEGLEMSTELT